MTWLKDSNTKLNKPTFSNPIEAVVSSELLQRTFSDEESLPVGFECGHCGNQNMFSGDDADYLDATRKRNITKPECTHCKKESLLIY